VDGREDGLIWPTPLGKRQTPMLAGRIDGTAPYGWNGEHDSLLIHIKSTVKNLEGKGLPDHQLQALAGYLGTMRGPAKRVSARERDEVAHGKTVFASNETGCSSCHIEDSRFTDHEAHALGEAMPGGSRAKAPGTAMFDTPSLAFVAQTAPYFHDGRFKTLEELVDGCDGVMGKTKQLSPVDRKALVAYLRTL
jgi:cytochrome c peroxidase